MLMREAAKTAKEELGTAVARYNTLQGHVQEAAVSLYELRKQSAEVLVARAEALVNRIADHPKSFNQTFSDFRVERQRFDAAAQCIANQYDGVTVKGASGAVVGTALGAATAVGGPTAAMAVATTFGTASTGTAISTLSGAAATNACLAWLGGGTLSAGGGGVLAGKALLALAGPIGWSLAGAALVGGVGYSLWGNHRIVEDAKDKGSKLRKAHAACEEAMSVAGHLLDATRTHSAGLRELVLRLEGELPASYLEFSDAQLEAVGAMVNNVASLSVLLNQTLETLAERPEQKAANDMRSASAKAMDAKLGAMTEDEKLVWLKDLKTNSRIKIVKKTQAAPAQPQGAH